MVFHRRLSDSKSPEVSRTLLSILSNLNNAVVWMISTHPLISKSSSPCTNPLVTVPRAPIGLKVISMFSSFFQFPSKVQILIFLFAFFHFYSVVSWDSKVHNLASSLSFVDYYKVWSSGRDWVIVCISKSQSSSSSHFLGQMLGCIYIICLYSQI